MKGEKGKKLRKGDTVKIVKPFKGFSMYGLRKGSIGEVLSKTSFRGKEAYQVRFRKARKDLTLFSTEIEKMKKQMRKLGKK